jgi:uncharacterized protein DUF4199
MKKIVLTFGLISGAILAAMMFITMPFTEQLGMDTSLVIGYTTMVLAFLLVFFGIRSYRETIGAGRISFLRALGVGLLIMLIASTCYVVSWEILYRNFMPDFTEKYAARVVEEVRASNKSPEEKERELKSMREMMERYKNNIIFNVGMTFIEPLPVGVVMTLISALILRKRRSNDQDLQEAQDGVKNSPVNPVNV